MLRRAGLVGLLLLLVTAPLARAAVGFQHFTIPDPQGAPIEVGVWYPTDAAPAPTRLELFTDPLAVDAPIKGERLPLVVISHGNGGSYAGHHDTAFALAEAGFVAAALTHTGDNWRDQSQATDSWERPRQLKVLIDYMLTDWRGHDRVDPARVGAFGFSSGGFTVLVAAGAEPNLATIAPHCQQHPDFFDCRLIARHPPTRPAELVWTHDARIRAVVAAAPAVGFAFDAKGLAGVRQPLQLWRAEDDHILPYPYYAEAVRAALPVPPESHLVQGADHYDFLPPCPAALAQVNHEICSSPRGFDRAAFHADFNRQVAGFFERTIGAGSRGAASAFRFPGDERIDAR